MKYRQLTMEERRLRLEGLDDPDRNLLVEETKDYLLKADLSRQQLATFIGYGTATLTHFLGGRYSLTSSNDLNIRRRLRAFLNENPVDAPQMAKGKQYRTENTALIRDVFYRCLALDDEDAQSALIYGPPGSQKSYTIFHLIAELNRAHLRETDTRPRAFYIYSSQTERPLSLTGKMLQAAGIGGAGRVDRNLKSLRFLTRRQRCLFIFDEAQHLSMECLEVIREIIDLPPHHGVLLTGSHKLYRFFSTNEAELEQWHRRLKAGIHQLPGVSRETLEAILDEEFRGVLDTSDPAVQAALAGTIDSAWVADVNSPPRQRRRYFSVGVFFDAVKQVRKDLTANTDTQGAIQ